jgi:hypothetical protein
MRALELFMEAFTPALARSVVLIGRSLHAHVDGHAAALATVRLPKSALNVHASRVTKRSV